MGAGVAVGAHNPYQEVTSKPGSVVSCMVGTSGSCDMRFRLVTASARTRPDWIAGSTAGAVCALTGIWPPITSESACGAPLYATCTTSIFAVSLISSIASCGDVPAVDVPYESLPGLALA